MPVVQRDLPTERVPGVDVLGLGLVLAVLGGLAATSTLTPVGWAVGLTCGVLGNLWLVRAMDRCSRTHLGPADLVTLLRAALTCGVVALVAGSFSGPTPVAVLVPLATLALALDWVDGRVARRTNTVSAFGARFDMEVDAFLILVLSVLVAHHLGIWVLAIGLARYTLLAAKQVTPWLRRPPPPRYWCKVVAAIQGITLTVVAADLLPPALAKVVLVLALTLLAESFGREVLWLSRLRHPEPLASVPVLDRAA